VTDADETDVWSEVAAEWARSFGRTADPARRVLVERAEIGAGTRVLDVGCGSGEFLTLLALVSGRAVGVDPAERMRAIAAASGHAVLAGDAEHLPVDDASFDVVTAVNALQFADDTGAALAEFRRVLAPGGRVAIANWAERERNDLTVVEDAVALADGDDPMPDHPLRLPGGLEAALGEAGFAVIASGVVDIPWRAADDEALVRGILLGESDATVADLRATVLTAAEPFRARTGYLLRNAFRWVVARP
jgi:SAM-dependent methyltransferase